MSSNIRTVARAGVITRVRKTVTWQAAAKAVGGLTLTKLAVEPRLGIAIGFLFVSKFKGEDYYDLHGHHIPEAEITKACLWFVENGGAMDVMHDRKKAGSAPFVFPYTTEFAKAVGNEKPIYTGMAFGVKPTDPTTLKRIDRGELVAFSLDGTGYETEV